jgi:3-deoxy-D-manno-octulosonic acid kinase
MHTSRGGELEKDRRLDMRFPVARAGSTSGAGAILYDPSLVDQPSAADFEPSALERAGRLLRGTAGGRGSAWFVAAHGGGEWVLRHFRRGGLVARLVSDRYLYTGEARVRAFREFRLLAELARLGLPAPRPVAARCVRTGPFYRADLLTVAIPHVRSLAELAGTGLAAEAWRAVGACVRRFHDALVCHADLNAHNVLIDGRGAVWLVDFDRGSRRAAGRWQEANLARLEHSLVKVAGPAFGDAERRLLREGYRVRA